jgi:large subunit ribosomal protein L13
MERDFFKIRRDWGFENTPKDPKFFEKVMVMKTIFVKPAVAERKWFVIDAGGKILGRVAARAASIVRGKEKAIYAPHQEVGDFVIVVNVGKIEISGRKAQQKLYYRHSGYVGGLKAHSYEKLAARHPTAPLENAIKGMLPKGPLGRKLLKNVKVYAGAEHPHGAQNPQAIEL